MKHSIPLRINVWIAEGVLMYVESSEMLSFITHGHHWLPARLHPRLQVVWGLLLVNPLKVVG